MRENPDEYSVDVLVSVYNHEASIATCLESILLQDHRNIVVTVIDDRSTDRSWEIILQFQAEYPDQVLAKRTARNCGNKTAATEECGFRPSGDFWAIIDGDDCWISETKISKQISLIHDDPTVVGCSGTTLQVGEDGKLIDEMRPSLGEWKFMDYLRGQPNLYVHVSSILWKNVFGGSQGYLPRLYGGGWPRGEWPLTLACLAESGKKIRHLEEAVSRYNFNAMGVWSILDQETRDLRNKNQTEGLRLATPYRYRLQATGSILAQKLWRRLRVFPHHLQRLSNHSK